MPMVEVEGFDDVSLLRLAHGKANALDLELLGALADLLVREAAGASRAVVLTGRGPIFCAGVDLPRLLRDGPDYVEPFLAALDRCLLALFGCPKPVVAAINGHAIAGGCVIACACDVRLAARTGLKMGVPELRVGVPFPPVPLEIMRWALPPPSFQRAVLGGATYGVDEAVAHGFVDEIVAADELLPAALARARDLAAIPAASFATNKAMLRQPTLDRLAVDVPARREEMVRAWSSPPVRAAIADYVARVLGKR